MFNRQTRTLLSVLGSCALLGPVLANLGCGLDPSGGLAPVGDSVLDVDPPAEHEAPNIVRSLIQGGSYTGIVTKSLEMTAFGVSDAMTEDANSIHHFGTDGIPQVEPGLPVRVGEGYVDNVGGNEVTLTVTDVTITTEGVRITLVAAGEADQDGMLVQLNGIATVEYTLNPDATVSYSNVGQFDVSVNGANAGLASMSQYGVLSLDPGGEGATTDLDGSAPGADEDACEVNGRATCDAMSWSISCETGTATDTFTELTTYDYYPNSSMVKCTIKRVWGTLTYEDSGNSYEYEATYDWCDCTLFVAGDGLGTYEYE